MKDFGRLVREAHGCKMPDASTHYIEDLERDILYDVYLWDWGVVITVPFPAKSALMMQAMEEKPLNERLYQVRPIDAIAYALASYSTQPEPVRAYLRGRFGGMLKQARSMGSDHWMEVELE